VACYSRTFDPTLDLTSPEMGRGINIAVAKPHAASDRLALGVNLLTR